QILIQSGAAQGGPVNPSGRVTSITDTRATGTSPSYVFTYASLNGGDAFPHLTGVTKNISSGESYTFAYDSNAQLASPFTGPGFGTATVLRTVTISNLNIAHSLQYGLGTGELTQVTMPAVGTLAWAYHTYTYSGSVVSYRLG